MEKSVAARNLLPVIALFTYGALVVSLAFSSADAAEGASSKPGIPQTADTSAEQSLRERCVKAGLRMPKFGKSLVSRPGDRKKQAVISLAYYRPMPEVCHGVYNRIPRAKLQFQSPRNPKKWLNLIPWEWPLYSSPNPELGYERVWNQGGKTQVSYAPYPFEIQDDWRRYRCTPGKRVTRARALYVNVVKNAATKEIVGRSRVRKVYLWIRPIKEGTAYNGAVPRAC